MLLVAPDRVGPVMAGPGIRSLELGRSLGIIHDIRLLAPEIDAAIETPPATAWRDGGREAFDRALEWAEVVVAPPLPPALATRIVRARRPWIADLYNPEPFEGLAAHPVRGQRALRALDALRIDRISFAVRSASAFVCAGERQRDMWLGYLAASRRVSSAAATRDPTLRSLVRVVGCGVPEAPPRPAAAPVVRGVLVPEDARIVLWNGGLWPWLDVATVVSAVASVRERDPRVVLVLAPGGRLVDHHGGAVEATVRAARDRLGAGVAVLDDWIPYERRGGLLLEADAGVCAHPDGVESRFAERLRLLDLVWAGTPVVTTDGDPLAELVVARGLGRVVRAGDPPAFASALRAVLEDGRVAVAAAAAATAAERRWSRVAAPLAELVTEIADGPPPRRDTVAAAVGLRHRAAERAAALSASVARHRTPG